MFQKQYFQEIVFTAFRTDILAFHLTANFITVLHFAYSPVERDWLTNQQQGDDNCLLPFAQELSVLLSDGVDSLFFMCTHPAGSWDVAVGEKRATVNRWIANKPSRLSASLQYIRGNYVSVATVSSVASSRERLCLGDFKFKLFYMISIVFCTSSSQPVCREINF